jgi:4-alpha-glucanotransferase
VDFLVEAGQKLWQTLPLGPTGFGDSPYQSFSAFAGQPLLISPQRLAEDGLLTQADLESVPDFSPQQVDYGWVLHYKTQLFETAFRSFQKGASETLRREYEAFCRENELWLPDYAFFMACKDYHQGRNWLEWERELADPEESVRSRYTSLLEDRIAYYTFLQFCFFRQWMQLKAYANEKGIRIIGDIPIFVSLDSADVWANKSLFKLDSNGYPLEVAGVPPDYFSETGQLWGNPLYDWEAHEKSGFAWWIARAKQQLKLFDILRVDHFRGFEAYWAVPYGEATAIHGTWRKAPGKKLFTALKQAFGGSLPIWAEDLGVITPEVEELRDAFHFPGMKVLQFAFEDPEDNDMMPEHYTENCICYPGTHDNNTTLGWYQNISAQSREKVWAYTHGGGATIHWDFIRIALDSKAKYAVLPMQDVLGLDSSARMNIPGVVAQNWAWRFRPEQQDPFWTAYLCRLTKESGR